LSKRKTEFASLTRYNKKRDFKQKRAQEENWRKVSTCLCDTTAWCHMPAHDFRLK
jgi:hypothetical protein